MRQQAAQQGKAVRTLAVVCRRLLSAVPRPRTATPGHPAPYRLAALRCFQARVLVCCVLARGGWSDVGGGPGSGGGRGLYSSAGVGRGGEKGAPGFRYERIVGLRPAACWQAPSDSVFGNGGRGIMGSHGRVSVSVFARIKNCGTNGLVVVYFASGSLAMRRAGRQLFSTGH